MSRTGLQVICPWLLRCNQWRGNGRQRFQNTGNIPLMEAGWESVHFFTGALRGSQIGVDPTHLEIHKKGISINLVRQWPYISYFGDLLVAKEESRKQLRGLTFIITDRGPMKRWQWVIKRADAPFCQCGEIQNAIHLTRCRLVADGAGRSLEQVWEDREWCEAVVDFLS